MGLSAAFTGANARPDGAIHLQYSLADSIGLTQALTKSFGAENEMLLGIAAYMMAHGNVMMNYRDWADGIASPNIPSLSSQKISAFFAELKEENRVAFFKEWMKKAQEEEFIAYDVMIISRSRVRQYPLRVHLFANQVHPNF